MKQLVRLDKKEWWIISQIRDIPYVFNLVDSKSTTRKGVSDYEHAMLDKLRKDGFFSDGDISVSYQGDDVVIYTPNGRKYYRQSNGIRRLFFDIEITPMLFWSFSTGKQFLSWKNKASDWAVICLSYKWEFEDKVHRLEWKDGDDSQLLRDFVSLASSADELVGQNGDKFDIRKLRARCAKLDIPMFPKYRTFDTYRKAKEAFYLESYSLDFMGEYFNLGRKQQHEGLSLWIKCINGDKNALEEMGRYCDQDVILLEDLYHKIEHYTKPNTHVGVHMGKGRFSCPSCGCESISLERNDVTEKGTLSRVVSCDSCGHTYNISNKSFMSYLDYKISVIR